MVLVLSSDEDVYWGRSSGRMLRAPWGKTLEGHRRRLRDFLERQRSKAPA